MKILLILIMISLVGSAFVVAHVKDTVRDKPTQTDINQDKPILTDKAGTRLVQGCDEVDSSDHATDNLEVKAPGTFKSFMDGCCITDDTSEAYWQLMKMYPDENGIYSEGYYKGVAMASYYGNVGDKFKITLSSGQVFMGVMTDIKQERHIDDNMADKVNGSLIEFVVDTESLPEEVRISGSLDCIYEGQILKIEKL